jgi:RND family efflux transporter MFP subunit
MARKALLSIGLALIALYGQLVAAESAKPTIITQIEQQLATPSSDFQVPALLIAPIQTTLASPMFGRVANHNVSLGSAFKKGDLLVSFVCADRNAQVAMGEAEFAAAQVAYENKLKLQGLSQAGEIEVTLAATEASRTKAQLDYFEALADQCKVRAPFSGKVSRVQVKPYQGVTQGEPLLEIISTDGLKAVMNIPANWLNDVELGNEVSLYINETGNNYAAKLSAINSTVDSISHTIEVEAQIINSPSNLLPGMSGDAQFSR